MKTFAIIVGLFLTLILVAGVLFFFGVGFYLSPQDNLVKVDAVVAISGGETDTRTNEAVRLYSEGWAKRIIFSGAALDPTGPSNAAAMANQAVKSGVPPAVILLDETSSNTRENAANVADIMRRENIDSIILVTSPYHQRRASIVFQRELGPSIKIINHSSADQNWRRSQWWATQYSRELTISELSKVIYELKNSQK